MRGLALVLIVGAPLTWLSFIYIPPGCVHRAEYRVEELAASQPDGRWELARAEVTCLAREYRRLRRQYLARTGASASALGIAGLIIGIASFVTGPRKTSTQSTVD